MRCFNKTSVLNKILFFVILFIPLTIYIFLYFKTLKASENEHQKNMKYILTTNTFVKHIWKYLGRGRTAFLKNGCRHTNCYVTGDTHILNDDVRNFDAILFDGRTILLDPKLIHFPLRSAEQKYIFAMIESAERFPDCSVHFDNFFNWTWTYRTDSSVRWGYISIYDKSGSWIGPKRNIIWPETFQDIKKDTIDKLKGKSKAIAWFVSNCHTKSKREYFVEDLVKELRKYKLTVDIFGRCGSYSCLKKFKRKCNEFLSKRYYFYLALENSFAEDYVTEKVLTALDNYAVPIVFGGANYSRFLPPGSYLNAIELGAEKLSFMINNLMHNKTEYYKYFRWRNHYNFVFSTDKEDVCNLCEMLNNEEEFNKESVYINFRSWWNNPSPEKNLCHNGKPSEMPY